MQAMKIAQSEKTLTDPRVGFGPITLAVPSMAVSAP